MRKGEKWVLGLIGAIVVFAMAKNIWRLSNSTEVDPGIPFYSTASPALSRAGSDLYRSLRCKDCHSLWTVRNMLEFVPAPALDGIGS